MLIATAMLAIASAQSALDIPDARARVERALASKRSCLLAYAEQNYASDVSVADLFVGAEGHCRDLVSSGGLAMVLAGLEIGRECPATPDRFCIHVDLEAEVEQVETEIRQDFFARVVALRRP